MLSYEEIALRMVISLLVGTIVGYERSKQQKPAGVRTYSLVCIGSTLFMIVSAYGIPHLAGVVGGADYRIDPGRIAAQIVTGIGFLGAGVIWKEGGNIRGLTTAANLWITAGLGMAIGVGLYFLVFVSVICIFLALYSSPILCRLGLLYYPDDQQQSQEQRRDTL
ncbi:MAG: Transporter MgtC/SapB family [Thermoanaerobacterales bacterium 50_218]|nr:MAG: Transporter MgtC/SapB family [Thermoanaerobacterales bacterium 50_218]HAA89889.1 magnesium transporter MgtC [Peptococcaceae bacterium]